MSQRQVITDGKNAFFLDQYPESAWTNLAPNETEFGDARQNVKAIANYYNTVSFLYRCVAIRSSALLRVPWSIMRGGTDVWSSEVPMPPNELDFLRNFRKLLRLTESALCLAPEAFWFRERNRVRTLGLRWHAPSSVIPQFDAAQGLVGFKRILDHGRTQTFEVDDYVYIPIPNPLHETMPGRPPAQAAMSAAGVLYSVDVFASSFFERGAIKATLLTVEGNPIPAEMQKLETWWQRFFAGSKRAWQTAAVRAGVTPVIVGEGMESLAQNDLTSERKADIATALGIPHSIVMSNAANFATAQVDNVSFYDKTIIPEFEFIAEELNAQLFEPMGMRIELRPEEMTIYQADENERAQSFAQYVGAGMKPSVAAEILGIALPAGMEYAELDPVETPLPPSPTVEQLVAHEMQSDSTDSSMDIATNKSLELARFRRWAKKRKNPNPDDFISDVLTLDDKAAALEADDDAGFFMDTGTEISNERIRKHKAVGDEESERRERARIEREAQARIEQALEDQRRRVTQSLREMRGEMYPEYMRTQLENDVALIRREYAGRRRDDLNSAISRGVYNAIDLGIATSTNQLNAIGIGVDWTLANEEARRWAQQHLNLTGEGITETTLSTTRQLIGDWIQSGEALSALIERLSAPFGPFSPERAELIASTEVTRAYAEAARNLYRRANIPYMEWQTAVDERVCPICNQLNGAIVSIDGSFDQALSDELRGSFPRLSFELPPSHPRCRCAIAPVISQIGI